MSDVEIGALVYIVIGVLIAVAIFAQRDRIESPGIVIGDLVLIVAVWPLVVAAWVYGDLP